MFSTADIDGKDFFLILSSFRGSLGMFAGGHTLSKGRLEEMGMNIRNLPSTESGRSLAKRLKKAMERFKPEIQAKKLRVSEDERGLVITLSGDAYFDPGSAKIKNELKPVLRKVAGIMREVPNFVRIEGHTDNSPITISGALENYETNWELSAARGVNVVRYLVENQEVTPEQLSAVAFAQYRPIDDNNIPEGRAFNRRIDIVVLRDKGYVKSKSKHINRPLPDEEWR
jgi:chemotaxis protein MotB